MKKKTYQNSKTEDAKLSPSPEKNVRVQTKPISGHHRKKNTENVTPRKDENVVEKMPSELPQPFGEGRPEGSDNQEFTKEKFELLMLNIWEPRLVKNVHFEKWESLYEGDFHLLFFWNEIFVLADDLARAATLADRLEPELEYTSNEIIGIVDSCNRLNVPGPGIPEDFDDTSIGTYVPLELAVLMLWGSSFSDDVLDFEETIEELEDRRGWRQEAMREGKRLRMARLRAVNPQELRRQKAKQQRAKLRSEKRKP